MKNKLLAVDKDKKIFSKYQEVWLKSGINSVQVLSMQEAVELLAREVFVIVRINADNIHYMPMLPMVRGLTKAHIGVVTSNFTMIENIEALKNGADNFNELWNNPDESVERGIILMQKCMEERNFKRKNVEFISYKDIVILLNTRRVYVEDKRVDMTTQDYNLLTFLIENPKQVYSCDQILEHVWGFEVHDDKNTLRSAISRLRKKLHSDRCPHKYIISRYDYGYSFDQ